ncbi:MAG: sulfotransferase [Acidimicrobiales bacterium]
MTDQALGDDGVGDNVVLGCFSRGGSSLVWNLLASHPALASAGMETHELFVGRSGERSTSARWRRHLRDALHGGGLPRPRFSSGHVLPNTGLFEASNLAQRRIPARMYGDVRQTLVSAPRLVAPAVDPVLAESSPGSGDVADPGAVVAKSINGIVTLTPSVRAVLGACRNVLLLRDGVAMCESRMRRGTFARASKFGLVYRLVVSEMRRQVEADAETVVVFFEDLLDDPVTFTRDLYRSVGLDPSVVDNVRLKSKPHLQSSGVVAAPRPGSHHFWIALDDLPTVITSSIDETQSDRLGAGDRRAFERSAGDSVEWVRSMRDVTHR